MEGVYTYSDEAITKVSAQRLFNAMILKRAETMQKVKADVFKSSDLVEGEGGVGSIRKITFVDGHPMKYFMMRIDEIDEANLYCKYTIFEGGVLHDTLEKIEYVVKYEAVGEECKAKVTVNYHPKPGCTVNMEGAKRAEEKARELFKTVEDYLLANPNEYA